MDYKLLVLQEERPTNHLVSRGVGVCSTVEQKVGGLEGTRVTMFRLWKGARRRSTLPEVVERNLITS